MANPGFNVSQFKAFVNNKGILKTNKFLVRFLIPQGFAANQLATYQGIGRQLEYWCEATNIPGVQLQTHDVRRYGYGPTEKKPISPVFTDVRCTFLGDGDGAIWDYFQQWLRLINNYDMRDGITSTETINTQQPFELTFKNEYVADVHIIAYDEAGQESIHVVLQEAYPIFVGDIQLDWKDNNQIMRIPVTFTFFNWYNYSIQPFTAGFNTFN